MFTRRYYLPYIKLEIFLSYSNGDILPLLCFIICNSKIKLDQREMFVGRKVEAHDSRNAEIFLPSQPLLCRWLTGLPQIHPDPVGSPQYELSCSGARLLSRPLKQRLPRPLQPGQPTGRFRRYVAAESRRREARAGWSGDRARQQPRASKRSQRCKRKENTN